MSNLAKTSVSCSWRFTGRAEYAITAPIGCMVHLGLNEDELAFYDALAENESAIKAMGADKLKVIAGELVTQVRKSVTIDWTVRVSARAKIRVIVRRILRKHGYPPDMQEAATKLVLEQAEVICADLAA